MSLPLCLSLSLSCPKRVGRASLPSPADREPETSGIGQREND